jgi:hypothetical protein
MPDLEGHDLGEKHSVAREDIVMNRKFRRASTKKLSARTDR